MSPAPSTSSFCNSTLLLFLDRSLGSPILMSCTCTFVMHAGPHPLEDTSAWFWERGTSLQEPNLASLANRVWWLCWCCQKAPAFSVHNGMVTVQLFAPNVLPQMPQSVTVKLSVDSLTLGDEFKFNTTLWMLVTTWRSRLDTAGCLDSKV